MVLGKLPVPGRPTIWITVRPGLLPLQSVRVGVVWTFLFSSILSLLFLPVFGLVGCFGFNGPLRQYFSLYRAVSQREGDRGEKDRSEKKCPNSPHPHLLQVQ